MEIKCPYCAHVGMPRRKKQMSAVGWVLFIVLLLFCLPLCWLPFVMSSMQEEEIRCRGCGIKLG